jgi:hypothetical protein
VTPGKEATPFSGTASAVPTMGEWKAQTREVTVTGSSKLNCETKMVREWLRVSCRGKNSDGGKPVSVKVLSGGGHGGDFVHSQAEVVATLVVRFKPGVDWRPGSSGRTPTGCFTSTGPIKAPNHPTRRNSDNGVTVSRVAIGVVYRVHGAAVEVAGLAQGWAAREHGPQRTRARVS